MNIQTFDQSVLKLLQHIQTTLTDEQWRSIDVPTWNAVTLKFKNNDHGYVGRVPDSDEWVWQEDGLALIDTHVDIRPATHLEKHFLQPKED